MAVIATRGKAAHHHVAPQFTAQRAAQQVDGGGIAFLHPAMGVQHHDTGGQGAEHRVITLRHTIVFIIFDAALLLDFGKFEM